MDLGRMASTETRELCSADSSYSCHNLFGLLDFFSTLAAHPPYFGLKTLESGAV